MKETTKQNIQSGLKLTGEILKVIAVGGLVASSVIVPNILQVIPGLGLTHGRTDRRRWYPSDISRVLKRLKRDGAIRLVQHSGGSFLQITAHGSALLAHHQLEGISPQKGGRWDKRWRLVIFDISERNKLIRDALRNQLRAWKFLMLQESVWIYPFDCEEAIELLKTAFRIRHDVYYLEVTRHSYDHLLRRHFRLN